MLKFETKGGGGGFYFEGIDPDHASARAKGEGGDGEKFFEKAAKIGDGDSFAQRRIGDEESDAGGAEAGNFFEVTKVARDKIGGDARKVGGVPVGASGLNGVGGEVGPEEAADSG